MGLKATHNERGTSIPFIWLEHNFLALTCRSRWKLKIIRVNIRSC